MNKYEMIKIGIMLTQIARDLFKILWKRQIMLTGQRFVSTQATPQTICI